MNIFRSILFALLLNVSLKGSILAADLWVSPKGSDRNIGTMDQPLASLNMALRKARELRRLNDASITGGIHIYIEPGIFRLSEPIFIRPEDSGTAENPTIIEGAGIKKTVLSGGIQVSGWRKATGMIPGLPNVVKGKVWVADAPFIGDEQIRFRQLWVGNKKAIRAQSTDDQHMNRILSWNHQTGTCWIPKPASLDTANIRGMEMFIHQWWAIAMLRIKTVRVVGDSVQLTFHQPESRIQSEHPWPAPWLSKKTGNSAFYLSNAISFLDTPGEWYHDSVAGKIYYIPHPGEDLQTGVVTIPVLENLVRISGTIDNPVNYIKFKGICFEHSSWLLPLKAGLVPHQAGMYMVDAYKLKIPGTPDKKGLENQAWVGRPKAAVEVVYASNISFEGCGFEHMASTGLDFQRGTHNDVVKGNLFRDIGGTAVLAGVFSDEAQEVHLPYNPTDKREICTNESIENNLIIDATNEDWGCVGIGAGYVKGISISHNEICDVNYTGISMGWGWTKTANAMSDNRITANKIHHYARNMYDVAGIYTLSAQPGSVISDNMVDSIYKAPYAHDPEHWFYLYTDEGSSYITIKNNWCPADKFLKNANGPGNVWENNGPQVSDAVKQVSGIQQPYSYLFKYRNVNQDNRPINSKTK